MQAMIREPIASEFGENRVSFERTSGSYDGFDRFGRLVDQKWYDYGASTDRERYTYGYYRAFTRTWGEAAVPGRPAEFPLWRSASMK